MRPICFGYISLSLFLATGCGTSPCPGEGLGEESVRLANSEADLLEAMATQDDPKERKKNAAQLQTIKLAKIEHNKQIMSLAEVERKGLDKFQPALQLASARIAEALNKLADQSRAEMDPKKKTLSAMENGKK